MHSISYGPNTWTPRLGPHDILSAAHSYGGFCRLEGNDFGDEEPPEYDQLASAAGEFFITSRTNALPPTRMVVDGGFLVGIISLVGLVGLYTTCVQLLDQIDEARSVGQTGTRLDARFTATLYLLKTWGDRVGFGGGIIHPKHHKKLDEEDARNAIFFVLASIEAIMADQKKLAERYGLGLQAVDSKSTDIKDVVSQLQKHSILTNQNIRWYRKAKWGILDKRKFESLVMEFEIIVDRLYKVVQPDEDEALFDMLQQLKLQISEVSTRIVQLQLQTELVKGITNHIQSVQKNEVLEWLGAITSVDELDEAIRERVPGSCEWILKKYVFLEWKDPAIYDGAIQCLWLHGGPGFGKTYLSARIIEHIRETSILPLAYFFCRNDNEAKRYSKAILASFVDQLASQRQEAFDLVAQKRLGKERRKATETELWELLQEMTKCISGCRFIIDGFDECSDSNSNQRAHFSGLRAVFLEKLLRIVITAGGKLLLVSRAEIDIMQALTDYTNDIKRGCLLEYPITEGDTHEDVAKLARHIFRKKPFKKPLRGEEEEVIIEKLAVKASGMFLWVQLEKERLRPSMNIAQLKRALDQMPTGLHLLGNVYERSLRFIKDLQEDRDRERAVTIIRWVMYATRPLTVRELVHSVITSLSDSELEWETLPESFDEDFINDWILRVCSSLVQSRPVESRPPEEWTIHLAHFSIKEYIMKSRPGEHKPLWSLAEEEFSHSLLAKICLSYIMSERLSQGPVTAYIGGDTEQPTTSLDWRNLSAFKEREDYLPFLPYAAEHWLHHFRLGQDTNPELISTALEFFGSKTHLGNRKSWMQIYHMVNSQDVCETQNGWINLYLTKGSENSLYYPAIEGLWKVVQEQTKHGVDVMKPGGEFGHPLQAAAYHGHESIVRLLLEAGADVNATGGKYGNALQAASVSGHGKLIQLLLDVGAFVNASGGRFGNALQGAAYNGHPNVSQILLQAGADVNLEGGEFGNALVAAADNGHESVVQLLLSAGAATSWTTGSLPWGVPWWQ